MGDMKKCNCKHNPGVNCFLDIKPCGKCGWKPEVSKRRLEKIKAKRAVEAKNA